MHRVATCLILLVAVVAGTRAQQAPAARESFDLVSVKRNVSEVTFGNLPRLQTFPGVRVVASNYHLNQLISWAYALGPYEQPEGSAMLSERFDITAQAPPDTPITPRGEIGPLNRMMQTLLEERFQLRFTRGARSTDVYLLVRADPNALGKQIRRFTGDCEALRAVTPKPGERLRRCNTSGSINDEMTGIATMADFSRLLGQLYLDRPVIDRTGFDGLYEMTMRFNTRDTPGQAGRIPSGVTPSPSDAPSLFSALREELGLKLEPQRIPMPTFIVNRVEMPAEN